MSEYVGYSIEDAGMSAAITMRNGKETRKQYVILGPGDERKLMAGADPIAEGWEDGLGHAVCWANGMPE